VLQNTFKKRFKGQGKKSSKEKPNVDMSIASVCLNTSGPEGEAMSLEI
jgi:hypothetical protein